ncbi:hypothetical protein F0562_023898 [Nyssa sinensis]|uniref:Uncharacterized protein n=1 Tax=Nyssa sinensis TaxID=561372 RepID=A0A5J5BJA7_9ASTE|nr:hypothetical protein F0562_023898 [Nyssa sinensis]
MPTGFRKPPLPLQPVQRKLVDAYNLPSPDSKLAGGLNLPSPDSVASDSSIASANSLSRHTIYQDPTYVATREHRHPASQTDPKSNISDPSSQIQMQQVQDYVYLQPPQQNQQQQFMQAGTHYIHHPATADATAAASSRPPTPPNTNIVAPSAAYEETGPPIYPTKTTTQTKPEMASSVYRTAATATPQLVQIPTNQFQQQYVGLSQMHHPSQSIANANYGFEYAQPTHDQVYYTQNAAAPLPPQYQTMTSAAAVLLSQASTQLPADNTKQQIITSQPL